MFNSKKVYDDYGVSGLIMPYIWLILYVYFHNTLIGLWFNNPTFLEYISLIIHVILTVIAVIFSHQVLLWAKNHQEKGVVNNFFSAIIRKMADSPIELINSVVEPIMSEEYEMKTKIIKFLFYLTFTLITVSCGYIIFIIVAFINMIAFIIERKNNQI